LLVEASKKKMRFTHFLSIPLNKKEIIDKYISFKNDVLEKYDKPTYNIDESLFQTPSKLHLTIGVLKLFDDDDKKNAIDALMNCKENVIE
jgi:activating signal cointegrator complex subunit 1